MADSGTMLSVWGKPQAAAAREVAARDTRNSRINCMDGLAGIRWTEEGSRGASVKNVPSGHSWRCAWHPVRNSRHRMSKTPIRDSSQHRELIRQTHDYYERNAEAYSSATLKARKSTRHELFLAGLPGSARILAAGCGAGRDSAVFLRQGYDVSAFDASSALCRLSSKFTGLATRQLRFQEFDEIEKYDGIWANASLLHVPRVELPDCIARLTRSLKPGGLMYMSFQARFRGTCCTGWPVFHGSDFRRTAIGHR